MNLPDFGAKRHMLSQWGALHFSQSVNSPLIRPPFDQVQAQYQQYQQYQQHHFSLLPKDHHRKVFSTVMAASEALQSFLARSTLQIVILVALPLALLIRFLLVRPSFPPKAPQTLSNDYPIIGAVAFFTKRWDFFRHAISQSPTGNFSFHLGKHPLIGVSGDEGRRVFFESKQLSFAEGYGRAQSKGLTIGSTDNAADMVQLRSLVWSRSG